MTSFTAEQCRLKIKSEKARYERAKKSNTLSGQSYDTNEDGLAEDFGQIPDIYPKHVLSSNSFCKYCYLIN